MSHTQKYLLLSIDYKEHAMPKQMSALVMSNLSRFSVLSHLVFTFKSLLTQFYTLLVVFQLTAQLENVTHEDWVKSALSCLN